MSRILRRAFSAISPRAGPSTPLAAPSTLFPSASSVSATLPQAVRRRRTERPPHPESSPSPLSDIDLHSSSSLKRFPYELEKDYQDLLSAADFPESVDEDGLRALFMRGQAEWRARARGYASRGKKGRHEHLLKVMGGTALDTESSIDASIEDGSAAVPSKGDQIVGQRIYLPNIQIRLMRNNTPPDEAYDPNIATFRIPPSMTKTDLRSYLLAVYGLKVTFIRTDNYIAPVGRNRKGTVVRTGGKGRTYKRAVVGLNEPFHYPDDIEELYAQGAANGMGDELAQKRDGWLQKHYSLRQSEDMRKRAMFKYYKGARWRSKTHANLGNTLREIMQRRTEREDKVGEEVKRRYAQGAGGAGQEAVSRPQAA